VLSANRGSVPAESVGATLERPILSDNEMWEAFGSCALTVLQIHVSLTAIILRSD